MTARREIVDVVIAADFPPTIGGAHGWLYQVYRRWPRPVAVVTNSGSDPVEAAAALQFDQAERSSLSIHRTLKDGLSINLVDWRYLKSLWADARQLESCLTSETARLHALRAFPEGVIGLVRKILRPRKTRLIVYAHGEEICIAESSRQLRWLSKLVYRFADLVIANSRNTERLVRGLYNDATVTCISPGVDIHAFCSTPEEVRRVREGWPWHDKVVVLCTVGRMERRKNHSAVIRALATLRNEGVELAYVCAGTGAQLTELRQLAVNLGVSDYVLFEGQVSDDRRNLVMQACDIHVMPSIRSDLLIEGFGIVFIEAAAASRPSIAGNSGGQAEAVQHGLTGIVVDGNSDGEVCAAIRDLLNPSTREQMGNQGREWAKKHDWNAITDATWHHVQKLEQRAHTVPTEV